MSQDAIRRDSKQGYETANTPEYTPIRLEVEGGALGSREFNDIEHINLLAGHKKIPLDNLFRSAIDTHTRPAAENYNCHSSDEESGLSRSSFEPSRSHHCHHVDYTPSIPPSSVVQIRKHLHHVTVPFQKSNDIELDIGGEVKLVITDVDADTSTELVIDSRNDTELLSLGFSPRELIKDRGHNIEALRTTVLVESGAVRAEEDVKPS